MDLYADNILDHYRNPRFKEVIADVLSHEEKNPTCGDEITVFLKLNSDVVEELHWNGTGCAISQAAMSMLAEKIQGMNMEDIEKLSTKDVHDMLGVPIGPRRVKCALLGLHALKNALRKHQNMKNLTWVETIKSL